MSALMLVVEYDRKEDKFVLDSEIKHELVAEIVSNFLRSQMGAGADDATPEKKRLYAIRLSVDLSDDSFGVTDDCFNKGLRDGILMRLLKMLNEEPDKVMFKE